MKCLTKKIMILSLIVLFGYGKDMLGYTYTIANMTDQDVKVRLHYAFGKLNKKDDLVKSYQTRKFSWKFPNPKFGLCLTKIMVSTEKSGKWEKQEAKIKFVTAEEFKKLTEIDVVGDIFAQALRWWGKSMCFSKDFILIEDPSASGKIIAITATTS